MDHGPFLTRVNQNCRPPTVFLVHVRAVCVPQIGIRVRAQERGSLVATVFQEIWWVRGHRLGGEMVTVYTPIHPMGPDV